MRRRADSNGSGRRIVAAMAAFALLAAACSSRISSEQPGVGASEFDQGQAIDGGGYGGGKVGKGAGGVGSSGGSGGSASGSGGAALPEKIPTARSAQIEGPKTANVCGNRGILRTGRAIQFPWAVQCLKKFNGDNGGETSRGVYRDRIRMAFYISRDPVINGATQSAGGCPDPDCIRDYANTYVKWFETYYELYGRRVELVFIEGSGSDSDERAARDDARRIISMDPPVLGVIGGPAQAGGAFIEELAAKGLMCFCTISLPQELYESVRPYVWSTLMSSTQAYIHRAQYVGQRLAHRKAKYAGSPLLRQRNRSFALVAFDNSRGDYRSGIKFFVKQLARYNTRLKKIIFYTNVEGCQIDSTNIVNQLRVADVTSVIMAVDPVCPIHLTKAADAQNAQWEWIITGSVLTDTNNFGRLYDQNQWKRAFGVSMLSPDVKNENDYWYKMYKEIRGKNSPEPKENAPNVLDPIIIFFTGVHLAGPNLSPKTFEQGMGRAITTGGTVTLPQRSYGPTRATGIAFWDTNSFNDMTEIWWDPNTQDPNGRNGAYWYVNGARRYVWGHWPGSAPKVFTQKGAIKGYKNPPDQ